MQGHGREPQREVVLVDFQLVASMKSTCGFQMPSPIITTDSRAGIITSVILVRELGCSRMQQERLDGEWQVQS